MKSRMQRGRREENEQQGVERSWCTWKQIRTSKDARGGREQRSKGGREPGGREVEGQVKKGFRQGGRLQGMGGEAGMQQSRKGKESGWGQENSEEM